MTKAKLNGLLALLCLAITAHSTAQAQLTSLPSGGNKKAAVTERIGLTDVTINYDRPAVKGREGQIWGKLIPEGYTDQGFGTSKAAPWRAGANENTTITFTSDVMIEGKPLPAGKYGFFIAYAPGECTLIFSRNNSSWGSFFYDPKEDALRVTVKPVALDKKVERLRYEFVDQKENAATVALEWEKLSIPFKVEVDYVNQQIESFRRELRNSQGFTFNSYMQAAQFCATRNVDLQEGLVWADAAISMPGIGDKNFNTMSTKAQVLNALNRKDEATAIMNEALPLGKITDVHVYARTLITQKRNKEALDAFQFNYNKHPNEFTTNMGLARGYSAMGDYKKALDYLKKAQAQAPDDLNKNNIASLLPKLEKGQDIN
jgi:tetratricopeptide (TPR) repeat protein